MLVLVRNGGIGRTFADRQSLSEIIRVLQNSKLAGHRKHWPIEMDVEKKRHEPKIDATPAFCVYPLFGPQQYHATPTVFFLGPQPLLFFTFFF